MKGSSPIPFLIIEGPITIALNTASCSFFFFWFILLKPLIIVFSGQPLMILLQSNYPVTVDSYSSTRTVNILPSVIRRDHCRFRIRFSHEDIYTTARNSLCNRHVLKSISLHAWTFLIFPLPTISDKIHIPYSVPQKKWDYQNFKFVNTYFSSRLYIRWHKTIKDQNYQNYQDQNYQFAIGIKGFKIYYESLGPSGDRQSN